jgi:WD40 repeat protein
MNTWESLPLNKPAQPNWVKWVWYPAVELSCAVDNTNVALTVYRLPSFELVSRLKAPGPVSATAPSSDGQLLAAAVREGIKNRLLVWDLVKGARVAVLVEYDAEITQLVFSPDNSLVGVSCADGVISIWSLSGPSALPGPPKGGQIDFFPDSKRLLFDAGLWRVWNPETSEQTLLIPDATQIHGFSADGRYLLTSANRHDLDLFDAETLKHLGTLRGHLGLTRGTGYSPDGKLLATASVDQTTRVWDLATLQEVATLGGFGERISDVKFSADGKTIILLGGFGSIKVYDCSAVVNRGVFATTPEPWGFSSCALAPDQQTLAARTLKGTVTVWNRSSRTPKWSRSFGVSSLAVEGLDYGNLAFSRDGKCLAWSTPDALRILALDSGQVSTTPLNGSRTIFDVAFSPDGRELAYGCRTQLMILDLRSRRQQVFSVTDDEVLALNYSPDGKFIAFGNRLGSVTLCERNTGHVLSKTNAHPPHVYAVEFSPDGDLVATCGSDASIKLWAAQPDGLKWKATLRGHLGYINGLAFSPDGKRLVSGAGDQTVKLWDTAKGAEVATLCGHTDYVGAAVSFDS